MNAIDPTVLAANDARIDRALGMSEGDTFEVKRVGKMTTALETIVVFANSRGGTLALGIEDAKKATGRARVFGIGENPESVAELRRMATHRLTPTLSPPPAFTEIPCTLRDGTVGSIVAVRVHSQGQVISTVEGDTWVRVGPSNRRATASEIVALAHQRGQVSVVDAPVEVAFDLLETSAWRTYASQRRLSQPLAEQLPHLGLAKPRADGVMRPTRAAVLLFAEHPGNLLNEKAAIRLFHYQGDRIERSAAPNLVRPPRTISGPLIDLIPWAVQAVVEELASGVQMGPFGFEIVQRYPKRVIAEAVTNAVLHRDYRIAADIHIRIFSNRIEVESPGLLPHGVTVGTVGTVGSRPRNRTLVDHLREFPVPPNLDGGEGVPMMFQTMDRGNLYPPIFVTPPDLANEAVLVRLSNQEKPSAWDQIDALLKTKATIVNADVRKILHSENPVAASKVLKGWLEAGLLVIDNPEEAKNLRQYRRPGAADALEAPEAESAIPQAQGNAPEAEL